LKISPKNQKDKKSPGQNNDQLNLPKILIRQIQDIEIANIQKTTKENKEIIGQMKNKGLLK